MAETSRTPFSLVGGPLDGQTLAVLLGLPQKRFQKPQVVDLPHGRAYELHSYRLAVRRATRQIVYAYEGTARSALNGDLI